MFQVITNHFQQAVARLMSQYGQAQNLQNFMGAIIQPIQDIEYVLNDMNTERSLANAFGVQLDNIGTIVGLARPAGASDAQYRIDLQAQIGINISEGQPEQVIQTYQLLTGSPLVLLDEYPPAEVMLEADYVFSNQPAVDAMIATIQEVLPAGVRCDGFISFDPNIPFAMDGALFGSGFTSDSDPTQGGLWPIHRVRNTQFSFSGNDVTGAGFGSDKDPLVGGWIIPVDTPPIFYDAVVPSLGNQVKVELMGVALAPLLPSTGVTGFTVLVNSVAATISSAVVEFNSKIILALSSPLIHSGDTVTVAYTPGNVTDSDGNVLAAFAAKPVINNSTM